MMKNIKWIAIFLISITSILIPFNTFASSSNANTLSELRKELATYKRKKANAESQKNKTQSQINASKNNISAHQNEIENNKNKINQSKKDIIELDKEILETEEKINELIKTYEISSSDKNYLEYIFKAKNISDFIVRYSVSEQLAKYNDELIEKYQEKKEKNKQLQKDLANREVVLNDRISDLSNAIDSLGDNLKDFLEISRDAQSDIDATEKLIKMYKDMGCGENENFNVCVKMRGDTGLIKPLNRGTITSYWGYRRHPVTGQIRRFHAGLDIGGNPEGTKVYSAANGMVGQIVRRSSCGGNQVYVYHTINGVKYTTAYMHLLSINVKEGQAVTNQTVIGTVGGGRNTMWYDRCTTGAHLHLGLAYGWYGSSYVSYSTYIAKNINPMNMINFPPKGKWFNSRYGK